MVQLFNSASTTYYDLVDPTKLPRDAKFIDPYDNTIFKVIPGEHLSGLVARVMQHRKENNYPLLDPAELKLLVVASLVETTPQAIFARYFQMNKTLPEFSQAVKFAKALAVQVASGNTVSLKTQEDRTAKCLKCPFHKSKGVAPSALDGLAKFPGLKSLLSVSGEQKLGVCGICGCGLARKIKFSTLAVLSSLLPQELDKMVRAVGSRAFSICWMVSEPAEDTRFFQILRGKLKAASEAHLKLFDDYKKE